MKSIHRTLSVAKANPIMKIKMLSRMTVPLLLPLLMLALTGCWTPPNANVQPAGEPRLIQSAIPVESVENAATVQAVDASQHSITLKFSDDTMTTCKAGPKVTNFDKIQVGDKVKVTLAEELTVYLLKDGRLPGTGDTDGTINFNARVQSVDPSYRLLTLQYLNGKTKVFKLGLDAKMLEMAPGDDVVARITEATAIRIEKQ